MTLTNKANDPRFNTKTDRLPDRGPGPERTYIRWDAIKGMYVTVPGVLPTKRKSGGSKSGLSSTKRRVKRLAMREGGMRCFWCHVELSYDVELANKDKAFKDKRYPTVDHVIELANGGPDTDDNCVLSCQPCNGARNKTFEDRRPRP